jgi:hypothetical protein
MKIITTVMAVAIIAHCSGSAQAQGTPQGSYLQTCTDVRIEGNALSATCRGTGNRKQRSSLAGFQRCAGDIGNNNGVLQCNFADGSPGRGTVVAAPRQQREGDERRSGRQYNEPAYGQPSNSGPYQQPSYGAPPSQYPNPSPGAPPYGQPSHGGPYQQPSYGAPPYGQPSYGGYR